MLKNRLKKIINADDERNNKCRRWLQIVCDPRNIHVFDQVLSL